MHASIICPTYNRANRHVGLYEVFNAQDYDDKDLWILDDSPSPSTFLREVSERDPRVHYTHIFRRMSIGAKRNWLVDRSKGDILVHFDDDDFYAPEYVRTMVTHLIRSSFDFLKLSVWNALSEYDGSCWQWDTRALSPIHHVVSGASKPWTLPGLTHRWKPSPAAFVDATLWGYGFSYAYKRWVWTKCPFADINHGEDYDFFQRLRKIARIAHIPDVANLVLHTIHRQSTSRIFPQTMLDCGAPS